MFPSYTVAFLGNWPSKVSSVPGLSSDPERLYVRVDPPASPWDMVVTMGRASALSSICELSLLGSSRFKSGLTSFD